MAEEKYAQNIRESVGELRHSAARYRAASADILKSGEESELYYAATLCRALCGRAKSTAKNMAFYARFASGEAARALAEDFCDFAKEISEGELRTFLAERGEKYDSITLTLLPDMIFAVLFIKISALVCRGESEGLPFLLRGAERLRFIDFSRVFLDFSVTNALFATESAGVWKDCDRKTKFKYIEELLSLALKEGKSEREMAFLVLKKADELGVHIGELLVEKNTALPRLYCVCLAVATFLVTLIYFLLCDANIFVLLTLPAASVACYGMAKELLAFCFKYAGGDGLMRLSGEKVRAEKAVIAIMSIISGNDGEIFERLENFYLADENENRFYAVVCNLPDSRKRRTHSDEKIIENALARIEALNAKYGAHFGIFVRERRYSHSERKYIGWERKRGAVLELCRFMRGEKTSISRCIADKKFLSEAKYLITLDSDTNLYAGAADELIGTMLHPMNRPRVEGGVVVSGHAIVQPHIAPTLESAAYSPFATVTAGNGGIDSYAGASFDIYENVFGSGSFCGKGIIDVDVFLAVCGDFFPNERILSHDLLEGNMAGAAIASDITLTDSTPKNAIAYYTRMHRWVRGDLQTVPYLFKHVKNAAGQRVENPMSAFAKYKIADNILGALCPFSSLAAAFFLAVFAPEHLNIALAFLFSYLLFPVLRALMALLLPGEAMLAARKFHARIMPHIMGSLAYCFYKICALPHEAYVFVDAAVRTAYRFLVSKQNFLNWKTAAAADGEKNGISAYFKNMWFSIAVGAAALFLPNLVLKFLGVLWLFFPFFAFLLSAENGREAEVSSRERARLAEYAAHMWGFFRENVNESTNFLPPDNVSVSPAERVAYRTSPTNIGLYLASLLGARDMDFISSEELCKCAEKTAGTLSSMMTWHGHFYNWYDIKTLDIIGEPFVSTVDSGNFVCSLVAFCEGISEYAGECPALLDVLRIYEGFIKNTDFSALYDKSARFFRIGYDAGKEKFSESYYDTFMSESRMTSFYAVASGQVPREHFFATARPTIGAGGYTGVASWSGTVFEYFMPALFLPAPPNSLCEEALAFAYREEKKNAVVRRVFGKKRRFFGVSESGYWHFDAEMNYQYKAFGLSELSLDPEGKSAPVVSPYSTFLMLRCGVSECIENLEVMKKLGAYGEYGFYEAIDCEKRRVGGGFAVVKSFMAHHLGMSFISAVNALKGDIFQKRFMRRPKMRAFYELLCEKIAVNSRPTPTKAKTKREAREVLYYRESGARSESVAAKAPYNVAFPDMAMLSNNKTRVLASSSGHIAVYNGENVLFYSDFERFSLGGGLCFYLVADGEVFPLVPLGARAEGTESTFSFEYDDEKISYISEHRKGEARISAVLTLRVFGDREMFSAECRTEGDFKNAELFVYGEPVMAGEKSFMAHKSFSGLFEESKYAADENVLIFKRREKTGGEAKNFMGVYAYPPVYGGAFDTKRGEILPLMYGQKEIAELAKGTLARTQGAMVVPALAMRTYRVGARGACGVIFAAASGEEEVLFLLSERGAYSPKRFSQVCAVQRNAAGIGRKTEMLKNYLLREFYFRVGAGGGMYTHAERDFFWRHGISGENHMVLARLQSGGEEEMRAFSALVRLFKYMCICGERFDLIVLYTETDLYRNAQKSAIETRAEREGCGTFLGRDGGIHVLPESAFSPHERATLTKLCEVHINLSSALSSLACRNEKFFELSPAAERNLIGGMQNKVSHIDEAAETCGEFTENGFALRKPHGSAPFAYILANERFGTVVTENSLGFSYFENAALGKLTPHTADAMREDAGERLILRVYATPGTYEYEDFDLCACAAHVDFSGGRAVFRGEAGGVAYTAEVCVEKEKSIKRVSVSLEKSEKELETAIIFAVKPCLGERCARENRYVFEHSGKCMFAASVFETPQMLALASSAENVSVFDDEAAVISDGRIFCGGGNIAAVCVRRAECADFYLAALTAEFGRAEFELLVQKGTFRPYTLPTMFEKVKINTNNSVFDLSVNTLFPYQTYYSRFLARSGFYQVGGAYGFRDQLQDSLSFIENAPWLCREQILRCAAHQYREGDVTHWWHTYAGKETGLRSRYSDDLLWLPFALCEYIGKTGDTALLAEKAPFLGSPELDAREKERYEELHTEGEGSVWEHALLAAKLAYTRGFGAHGLLLFGGGDWNDGMNLVGARGTGESVWLTEFCAIIYLKLARICAYLGEAEDENFFCEGAKKLYAGVCAAFAGEWYLRGYYDGGEPLGVRGNDECEIDSLSQSFAVFLEQEMFGYVSERTKTAINAAYAKLFDRENGIMKLLSPPFDVGAAKPGYIKGYIPGIRENGGQYTHAAVWAAMALLLAGETEKGTEVLTAINPAVRSREEGFCKKYKIEPYALAGDVYSGRECVGRGGWSHYTGAAAWYRKAVLECVFGLRLREDGFSLAPHMSETFDGAELAFDIRGTRYRVRYTFCEQSGAVLDGRILASEEKEMQKYIFPLDGKEHSVDYCMKKRG
ncbi:MAG: hypothetical protein IJX55_10160 [Clostridia bacterium]|nr:hypothetical protein [Clostridia bacterium]